MLGIHMRGVVVGGPACSTHFVAQRCAGKVHSEDQAKIPSGWGVRGRQLY